MNKRNFPKQATHIQWGRRSYPACASNCLTSVFLVKIFSFTSPFSGNKNYAREAELIAVRGRYCCRVSSCSALLVVQKSVHCISALWQPYGGTEVVELFSGFPDEETLQGKKTDFCDCE
jgi:hypothetical protein